MKWEKPKTNWQAGMPITAADINRIVAAPLELITVTASPLTDTVWGFSYNGWCEVLFCIIVEIPYRHRLSMVSANVFGNPLGSANPSFVELNIDVYNAMTTSGTIRRLELTNGNKPNYKLDVTGQKETIFINADGEENYFQISLTRRFTSSVSFDLRKQKECAAVCSFVVEEGGV